MIDMIRPARAARPASPRACVTGHAVSVGARGASGRGRPLPSTCTIQRIRHGTFQHIVNVTLYSEIEYP